MTPSLRLLPEASRAWLAGLWLVLTPVLLQADPRVPVFAAHYAVKVNGIGVGEAEFSLVPTGTNQYLYQQSSHSTGLATLFGRQSVKESSRWTLTGDGIRPLEYRYQRDGGDDDDRDVQLVFDWAHHRVENRVAGQPWSMDIPDGTLDKLLVQVAMLIDLRAGRTEFDYPVADGGRLKHYRFAVVGEENLTLDDGEHHAVKLKRTDDNRDQTYIWVAPDMNYIPIRFLKLKRGGIKYELRLTDYNRDAET